MRNLYDDICREIRRKLKNALFSWDINVYLNRIELQEWWKYFDNSKYIDFVSTSGGLVNYLLYLNRIIEFAYNFDIFLRHIRVHQ